jgi:hypothetical protein
MIMLNLEALNSKIQRFPMIQRQKALTQKKSQPLMKQAKPLTLLLQNLSRLQSKKIRKKQVLRLN